MGDNFKPSLGRGSAYGMDVFQVHHCKLGNSLDGCMRSVDTMSDGVY